MTGYMRRSRLARMLAEHDLDMAMRRAERTGGLCAHCPDCETPLEDEAFSYWCPSCKAVVSHARVIAEGGDRD